MYKTLIKVLLGVIVIIIIAFYLENRANTPEACANIEGLWNSVDEVCETPTETVIFQSLSKPNPVSLFVPESNESVKLSYVEKIDGQVYFRGQYERGVVYLNMSKFALLTTNTAGLSYFSAPFTIHAAGSAFTYIGLFSYDFSSHQATHISSEYLGLGIREATLIVEDRSIVEEEVFVQNALLNVKFKVHGPQQMSSEYPTQSREVLLQLVALDPKSDKKAGFRLITDTPSTVLNTAPQHTPKVMHPSWDENNDGLNDCEQEGSCDHTIDYSAPKPALNIEGSVGTSNE